MASKTRTGPSAAYRWDVFLRVAATVVPGYAATSAAVILMARLLPMARTDALLTANMLSFALYTVLIIRAFTVRSAARAWAELGGWAVLLGLAAAIVQYMQEAA